MLRIQIKKGWIVCRNDLNNYTAKLFKQRDSAKILF